VAVDHRHGGWGGGFLFFAYTIFPHVAGRINQFLTGEGNTFQVDTAHDAIMRGGWFGVGPGEGIGQAHPARQPYRLRLFGAAEEFGIIFCMALAGLYLFVVMRGLAHAFRDRNDFTRFAVAGLVLQIGFQSIINIGVNLQLLPAKGMTLPLISYGGSSQIAICVTAGFILALTRHRPEKRAQERSLFRSGAIAPAE
jgi:cell division protein FtsW